MASSHYWSLWRLWLFLLLGGTLMSRELPLGSMQDTINLVIMSNPQLRRELEEALFLLIADFKQGIRPEHPEFAITFFNKREPLCVPEINTCNASPGYPSQIYGSCNDVCLNDDGDLTPPESD